MKELDNFLSLKKKISKKLGIRIPRNPDLREAYESLIQRKMIERYIRLEKALFSKKIRTESGVAVVAVLTKEYPCPGKCIYCPTEEKMPKSYLSNEPAVMRAITAKFDPYTQVHNRLRALELNGHAVDKIELIVMGGTFSYLPKNYQKKFITECFRACNDYPKKSKSLSSKVQESEKKLIKEQKRNEEARSRIIGITLETRPDYIDEKEIINFRRLGCTRVELGVQSIFDDVLVVNKRGHGVKKTIRATKLLKDAGFKINYHMMPGLPGSDPKKDMGMFRKLFSDPSYRPDMLKIYPTVVVRNSTLYNLWKKGKYTPLTDEAFKKFIVKVKNEIIPPYVRIARLVRDVPETSIIAGPKISNIRQLIAHKSLCRCIRCREIRSSYTGKEKIILDRINYKASDGQEIFLQYVSPNKKDLFALLRLRIPSSRECYMNPLKNAAIIREVHTYGKLTEVDKHDKKSPQHTGLGKKLIQEAERIAKSEYRLNKVVVISGVGVRGYYRKLGYRLKDTYMVKNI